jgi:uncharacterized protein YdeI (YjbR/CyaY-like superfamily)
MTLTDQPVFFNSQREFRSWLEQNHDKATEIIVGYYKVGSGRQNMTWSQSVDQALCFGWIDGIRRSIDKDSYCIRFTPRRTGSIWSVVNIKKVEELTKQGLMNPAGIAAFSKRKDIRSGIYGYEQKVLSLTPEFEKKFHANKKAREFFRSLPPSYQSTAIRWIMSAKQEITRIKRLQELIADSEAGRRIKALSYGRNESEG